MLMEGEKLRSRKVKESKGRKVKKSYDGLHREIAEQYFTGVIQ